MTPQELGAQMRAAREETGLTMKAVARRLFVATYTVRRWEHGTRMPQVDMLDAYLRVVGGFIVLGLSTSVNTQEVTT